MKMANEGLVANINEGLAEIAARAFHQAQLDAELRREAANHPEVQLATLVAAGARLHHDVGGSQIGAIHVAQHCLIASRGHPVD